MNEKIANEVLLWLQTARSAAETQAPEVARELVRFGLYDSAVGVAFALAVIALVVFGSRRMADLMDVQHEDRGLFYTLASLAGLLPTLLLVDQATELIKVIVAPRVFILEKLTSLASGS